MIESAMNDNGAMNPTPAEQAPTPPAPEGLVGAARRESVDALRAIKMGQFNDATSGLEKARGTIGLLTGHIFQLIIALGEARLAAETIAGKLMEATLAAKVSDKPLTAVQKRLAAKEAKEAKGDMPFSGSTGEAE